MEHDADEIRSALQAVLGELLAGFQGTIASLGITNQRETVFALDRKDGRALGRGIVWQDRRTADRCQELRAQGHEGDISQRTGLVLDPYFSASKIEWLCANRPEVQKGVERGEVVFATVNSLVLQTLCPSEPWRTDGTNACRTMLYDIDRSVWSPELAQIFGVPLETLPEVLPSQAEFGIAELPGGQRVPVRGMAGDQQAALFGQGCWNAGDSKTTYGTGCFLMLNTGERRVNSKAGLLTTLALDAKGQSSYALEGSIFTGGAVIQWLRDGLGCIENAQQSEELAAQVPDTGGVVLIPAFAGLGAPHWDAGARAAILGLTRGSTRQHIARAALQSIALQCVDIIEVMRQETGLHLSKMRVDGGAVRNGLLMQMQADLAQVEILRPKDVESTARGAAALAGIGAGLWETPEKAQALADQGDGFAPAMDETQVHAIRAQWQDALARIKTRFVTWRSPRGEHRAHLLRVLLPARSIPNPLLRILADPTLEGLVDLGQKLALCLVPIDRAVVGEGFFGHQDVRGAPAHTAHGHQRGF